MCLKLNDLYSNNCIDIEQNNELNAIIIKIVASVFLCTAMEAEAETQIKSPPKHSHKILFISVLTVW